jgi:hypothetical protein
MPCMQHWTPQQNSFAGQAVPLVQGTSLQVPL